MLRRNLHALARQRHWEGWTAGQWCEWVDNHPAGKKLTLRERNAIVAIVWGGRF